MAIAVGREAHAATEKSTGYGILLDEETMT